MILALKVLLVTVLNQNIIKKYSFFTTELKHYHFDSEFQAL